jgi:hypothetical protein
MRRLASTLAGRHPFSVEAAIGTSEHESRAWSSRSRSRRVARLVDTRAAACLAPTASRRTAGGSQPRPADPSPCLDLQERTHGGASAALRRRLHSLSEASEKGALAVARGIVLKAGTTLVRQWRGHTHTVLVQKDGFEHEGQRYRSLTVIAEQITGAHWSGPRFFGLTKNARASSSAGAGQ